MKKIIINSLLLIGLFTTASCTKDYKDINKNTYGVTDEELAKSGVVGYGNSFLQMQQYVIPIGAPVKTTGPGNDLQVTDLISSGNYIGYFGNNNNWNFNIEATWNFNDGRMSYAYECFYTKLFTEWNSIKNAIGNTEDIQQKRALALANIIKITAWLRATDVFGPIVYTNAGKGELAPSLDKQENVYKAMLQELEQCLAILDNGTTVMADYDLIYGGNIAKWKKFANSLMLRMAVRAHFKDAALANTYITKALAGGVMTEAADEAKIANSPKQPLKNSMIASIDYSETRMGLTIWSYLKGYNDPRIAVLFKKGTYRDVEDYYAVAPTASLPKYEGIRNTAFFASKPNVDDNSPLSWMRTSEVLFLKAEAALYGLGGLSASQAQGFYEEGVRMSFQEMGTSMPSNYLSSTNKPQELNSYWYAPYTYDLVTNNISPKWNDVQTGKEEEQHLQKIITQKYLAMYPNAVEAWTEYRRTGYPLVMKYQDTDAPNRIGCPTCFVPERFKYSAKDYLTNNKLQTEVPTLLGGPDVGSTRLWWVRPNRPQQN